MIWEETESLRGTASPQRTFDHPFSAIFSKVACGNRMKERTRATWAVGGRRLMNAHPGRPAGAKQGQLGLQVGRLEVQLRVDRADGFGSPWRMHGGTTGCKTVFPSHQAGATTNTAYGGCMQVIA